MEQRSDLLMAQTKVMNLGYSFINSVSLTWAVELGVADVIHLHGGPMTAAQLAAALPIHQSKSRHVARFMRLLAHSGLFTVERAANGSGECAYALNDVSRLLLADNPLSVSPSVRAIAMPGLVGPWRSLGVWFQGEAATPFITEHGVDFWEYARADNKLLGIFGDAMARDSELVARALVGKPEFRKVFEGLGSLVDVGGGFGTVAKVVAAEFPETECVVFDLPHVVAGLEGSHNLKFVGGSMFEAIPPCEAVLLKWVLHDWADEESVKILEQCKKAITSKNGKVIIIDMVIAENNNDDHESLETQLFFDMQMMVLVDGRERTEKEWSKLFSDAGFSSYNITHGLGIRSIIEVYS